MCACSLGVVNGRGGTSSRSAPNASGRAWMLIGNNRTLALWRQVRRAGGFGLGAWCVAQFDQRVRSVTGLARPVILHARAVCELRVQSNSEACLVIVVTVGMQVTVGGSGGHG
jgi:hypothetical protein